MKKIIYVLTIFTLVFSFASCEDDTPGTFNVGTVLTDNIEVSVNQTLPDEPATIDGLNQTISLNNVDTQGHLDALQAIEITSLSFQINNFSGDVEGELLTFTASAEGQQFFDETNIIVSQAAENGVIYTVPTAELAGLTGLANALLNDQEVQISYSGTVISENDIMEFTIVPEIGVSLTIGM